MGSASSPRPARPCGSDVPKPTLPDRARRLARRRPRTFAAGCGFATGVGLLLLAEGVCFFLNRATGPPDITYGDLRTEEFFLEDEVLGFRPKPNVRVRSTMTAKGKALYDAVYSIDARSRRVTRSIPGAAQTQFALFFGGSYTFGQGVNDDETIPYQFARLLPRYRAYNYGFCGYGPQQMLAKLQTAKLACEIDEPSGIAIYILMEHHIRRAIGSMYVHNTWGRNMPYYALEPDGRLVRKGTFTTGRPAVAFMYRVLGASQILKRFHLSLPLRTTERHILLTCRIIQEAGKLFREQFDDGGFLVLIYPGTTYADRIAACLRRLHVPCLDYSALVEYKSPAYTIPVDEHPSPAAHLAIAQRLARDVPALGDRLLVR